LRWSEARALVSKDCRELFGSTAFALLALVIGPLVGMSLISAVRAYAEASGAGQAAALASALSPLDGILVPAFGAYDLLITFLVPFVAIRLIAAEKSSGGIALLLQTPVRLRSQLAAKVVALLAGWSVCLIPAIAALASWRAWGGYLSAPETFNLLLGHTLRYLVTCSVAMTAAAIFDGAASAAIAVLSITIGAWALDFFAAGRGGWVAAASHYTPSAMLRQFERGLLEYDAVIAAVVVSVAVLSVAAACLDLRASPRSRAVRIAVALVLTVVVLVATRTGASADLSEDRRNSFSSADERLLQSISEPVTIRIHLAAEDPRANDYERNVMTKLRRTLPLLRTEYPYAGRSALFDGDDRYGTIVYRVGAKEAVSRSTTEEIVLDELETLAGLTPPQRGESEYAGHPLNASPRGAATLFYVIWPLLVIVSFAISRRPYSRRTG
jgi:ABC-2 type transport system permease protein